MPPPSWARSVVAKSATPGPRGRAGRARALRGAEPREQPARRDGARARRCRSSERSAAGVHRELVARRAARVDLLGRRRPLAPRARWRRRASSTPGASRRSTSSCGAHGASAYASLDAAEEGEADQELEGGWAVAVVEQRREGTLGADEQGHLDRAARPRRGAPVDVPGRAHRRRRPRLRVGRRRPRARLGVGLALAEGQAEGRARALPARARARGERRDGPRRRRRVDARARPRATDARAVPAEVTAPGRALD